MPANKQDDSATKKDLEELKNELLDKLASKDELKNLATKDELKKLATKEELQKLATKEEIKKLATKEELKETNYKIELLANEVINIGQRITRVEGTTTKILEIVDGIAREITDQRTEKVAFEHGFRRHENRLDDHEQ